MLKVLPIKESEIKTEPFFVLDITIGYGEHCDDMFTHNHLEINDKKIAWQLSLPEDFEPSCSEESFHDYYETYLSEEVAVKIVKFFESLFERENEDGYEITHIVLNDGPSEFWWKKHGGMTDEEFEWFSKIYDEYSSLFYPNIENNWYGVYDAAIYYFDENGHKHDVEII